MSTIKSRLAALERQVEVLRWSSDNQNPGMVIVAPFYDGVVDQAEVDRQVAQRRYPPQVVITIPDNGRGDRYE